MRSWGAVDAGVRVKRGDEVNGYHASNIVDSVLAAKSRQRCPGGNQASDRGPESSGPPPSPWKGFASVRDLRLSRRYHRVKAGPDSA